MNNNRRRSGRIVPGQRGASSQVGSKSLVWVSPTLFDSEIELDAQQTKATVALSAFRSLSEHSQVRIATRAIIEKNQDLRRGLGSLWNGLPEFIITVPCLDMFPPTIGVLGHRQEMPQAQLEQLSKIVHTQARVRNKKLTAQFAERFEIWQLQNTPNIVVDLKTGALVPNSSAKHLLEQEYLRELQSILGFKTFLSFRKKVELGENFEINFKYSTGEKRGLKLKAKVSFADQALVLALSPEGTFYRSQTARLSPVSKSPLASTVSEPAAAVARPPTPAPTPAPPVPAAKVEPSSQEAGYETASLLAWIVCEDMNPVPVGASPILKIGRSEKNDLILPDKEVSRFHAILETNNGRAVIYDNNSSNGIFVGDHQVDRHELAIGDALGIGPYMLHVRAPSQTGAELAEEKLEKSNARAPISLAGDLHCVRIGGILMALELQQKTGSLRFLSDGQVGMINTRRGILHSARWGKLRGRDAIFELVQLRAGQFLFINQDGFEDSGMAMPIYKLIDELKAERQLGESKFYTSKKLDLSVFDE